MCSPPRGAPSAGLSANGFAPSTDACVTAMRFSFEEGASLALRATLTGAHARVKTGQERDSLVTSTCAKGDWLAVRAAPSELGSPLPRDRSDDHRAASASTGRAALGTARRAPILDAIRLRGPPQTVAMGNRSQEDLGRCCAGRWS